MPTPSHTYYKYRLRNYEDGWMETGAAGMGRAVYTGLRPGEYEFEVYSANADKVWSKEPARLSITVHPPFWATYYAWAIYVLAVAFWYTGCSASTSAARRRNCAKSAGRRPASSRSIWTK